MNKKIYLINYFSSKYLNILPHKLDIDFGSVTHQTLGDCIKELIEASYKIYSDILKKGKSTIICGGQSPAYYCLAMMNLSIYNHEIVNIVILPHSKGGLKTDKKNVIQENSVYCERIKENNLDIRNNITIIDGVHTGTGILALESALRQCFPNVNINKIAINAMKGISEIRVDQEIILPCEPKFSDTFPRLVQSYHPRDFSNSDLFINDFIGLETNPIAQMIIQLSSTHPEISIKDSEWFLLNNVITPKIQMLKEDYNKELLIEERKKQGGYFKPIILFNPTRYQCPFCKTITGTAAPENPYNLSLFSHDYHCINRFKIPMV